MIKIFAKCKKKIFSRPTFSYLCNSRWFNKQTIVPTTTSCMCVEQVVILFHPRKLDEENCKSFKDAKSIIIQPQKSELFFTP